MSRTDQLPRRRLFDLFRREQGDAPPPPAPFSLAAFYERRETVLEAFPRVVLRPGVAATQTTRVGAGPSVPAGPPTRGDTA
ncbi:MAG: hypothetical protein MUF34_04680 [Polyangiaceae bacterium]|jgi:hypothetical protein|nr:hypothetical protein [Polyangiaceae bacterium]